MNSITAYNLGHKFKTICLSEIYLNNETLPNDANLEITGFNMFRFDHSFNYKRGHVFVYYKPTFENLSECISFEISIANKLCRFVRLHTSLGQTQAKFQTFKSNLQCNLDAF